MQSTTPPAGWFPDPGGSASLRWWSGERWTEHLRDREAAPATAAAAAATPATPQPAAAVGNVFSSQVDPEVAHRYRTVVADEPATPASAPAHPPVVGDPSMPGWAGMPLPGGAPDPSRAASASPSPSWSGNGFGTPGSGSPTPGYAAASFAPSEPNKIATSALVSGLIAVGFAVFNTFGGFIATGALITGTIALVQGIIGAVRSSRLGTGRAQAIGAIVAGGVAVLIVVGSFLGAVVTALNTPLYDVAALEEEIVVESAELGITLTAASCPDNPPVTDGTYFTCTAVDTRAQQYRITVTNEAGGFYSWVITPA